MFEATEVIRHRIILDLANQDDTILVSDWVVRV